MPPNILVCSKRPIVGRVLVGRVFADNPLLLTLLRSTNNVLPLNVRPHKKFLVFRPLKIEKVMRACVFYFYFLSFLQGQIEIFETIMISQLLHIMCNVFLL